MDEHYNIFHTTWQNSTIMQHSHTTVATNEQIRDESPVVMLEMSQNSLRIQQNFIQFINGNQLFFIYSLISHKIVIGSN